MATATGKGGCITSDKKEHAVRSEGYSQLVSLDHLTNHNQEVIQQLDEIEVNRDLLQTLAEQTPNSENHPLIEQIDQWEEDSIRKIQQTAEECRQLVIKHTTEYIHQIGVNLTKLTDQLKESHQEDDFNEIDLQQLKEKLTKLSEELDKPSNISVQYHSQSLVNKIAVVVSSGQLSLSSPINSNPKWIQNGITVAGGNGQGDQLNQLSHPSGIYIDDDNQCIYIADCPNHRIVKWNFGATSGQIVAGGNGAGSRMDQLNLPRSVAVDRRTGSLIICDQINRRVVRWPCQKGTNGRTIIRNINCWNLTIDDNGDLYVSDRNKDAVKRWKIGDTNGTIVAGGNKQGDRLDQLNFPTYVFVDKDCSVYVTDRENRRVMKWMKDAKEGIVVAGGPDYTDSITQYFNPQGVIVDHLGNVYLADSGNHRVLRWTAGSKEVSIVVGGNGNGQQPNQFNNIGGLAFDREGNLYVADFENGRIQKFHVEST